MSDAFLECHHLVKRYGDATVVDDLSFAIHPGECLGVIGPNGAGKTTTLRMCLGLTEPDAGEVRAFGLRMPQDAHAIKAQIGVVTQFDSLDPDFSCAENLLVFGRYFGLKASAIRERIPALLEFAALTHKADAKPGQLSGGMRRRLSLARALVNDPRLSAAGRAHHRPGPAGAPPDVGAAAAVAAARQVHPAYHPLHGRGRAPVRPPAGHRPRPQDLPRARHAS